MVIAQFRGDYRFLSNFYPSPFTVRAEGMVWLAATFEHGFQAAKVYASEGWDHEQRVAWLTKVMDAPKPGQAKALGRKIPLDTARWEAMSLDVMRGCLLSKFDDEDLRARLLATGDALLVEGNTWGDTKWGVCRGVGENLLGKTLMQVRDTLRNDR
jgi:ribA/ribD-fused uncharacterized protein